MLGLTGNLAGRLEEKGIDKTGRSTWMQLTGKKGAADFGMQG